MSRQSRRDTDWAAERLRALPVRVSVSLDKLEKEALLSASSLRSTILTLAIGIGASTAIFQLADEPNLSTNVMRPEGAPPLCRVSVHPLSGLPPPPPQSHRRFHETGTARAGSPLR